MNMNIESDIAIDIRRAEREDLLTVASWFSELEEAESVGLGDLRLPRSEDFNMRLDLFLESVLQDKFAFLRIAEVDGIPVGMIHAQVRQHPGALSAHDVSGYIQALWVQPVSRGKGVASALLESIERDFALINIPYCEVAATACNQKAAYFWKTKGYKVVTNQSRKNLTAY